MANDFSKTNVTLDIIITDLLGTVLIPDSRGLTEQLVFNIIITLTEYCY